MSDELIVSQSREVAIAQPQQENVMAVIARAAADPSVNVEKMQALLEMQERIMRVNAEVAFKSALARIQPKMPRVTKNGRIEVNGQVRSRFAKYEDVDKAIRPLLAEEGFAVDFDTQEVEKALRIVLRVSHREGHSETRTITLPLDISGSKNATQGVGSTMQYGKRYLICGFFNIITTDEDDDGNGGCITLDQANRIEDMLIGYNVNRAKFLEFMGCSEVDCIPASQYDKAVNALSRKKR